MRRLLPSAVLGATLAAALLAAVPARGQTDEARQQAARAFAEGERAFGHKEYARAAERFEEAYRLAPHPNALWNEARALLHAGEKAPAANAYARYLREAEPDAHDRAEATRQLDGLAAQLLRLDATAPGFDVVLVDDRRAESLTVYVEPGPHAVEGRAGERVVRATARGDAGAVVAVTLALPAAATSAPAPSLSPALSPAPSPALSPAPSPALSPAPSPALSPAPSPALSPSPSPSSASAPAAHSPGWSPAVVWIGGGLTALAVAGAIASGVDTLSYRAHTYDPAPTPGNYDAGVAKMKRTNFLLGVSVLGGLFTGGAALWLVDWRAHAAQAALGVGPASVQLAGAFR